MLRVLLEYGQGETMNSHYNQNYKKTEIELILEKIKDCVQDQ